MLETSSPSLRRTDGYIHRISSRRFEHHWQLRAQLHHGPPPCGLTQHHVTGHLIHRERSSGKHRGSIEQPTQLCRGNIIANALLHGFVHQIQELHLQPNQLNCNFMYLGNCQVGYLVGRTSSPSPAEIDYVNNTGYAAT